LCRGRIKSGTLYGKTPTALQKDRPVTVPDLLAPVAKALGIDPTTQNISIFGRPIRIVDVAARPIGDVLA